jgi:hypothetical protein
MRRLLVLAISCAGVTGCSAHDRVKPYVDEATGGAGGGAADGGGIDTDADRGAASADCNMTGIWVSKLVTVTQALNLPQYATVWYYLEIDQPSGSVDFTVTKAFDCGTEVHGSVTVTIPPATFESHIKHNSQAGRKGTMKKNAAGRCDLTAEPFWSLLGAHERFLPPRNTAEEIGPVAARLPLPTLDRPDGAEDWDNDGRLGLAWQVSGILQGSRSAVQRQWTTWFTTDRYAVTPALDWGDIIVGVDFDKDDAIFDPTSGPLVSPSYSVRTPETPNRHLMRFLGRTPSDARLDDVVRGTDPANDVAAARETCLLIQDALPAESM